LWPLLPISKENSIAKNSEFMSLRNHKSADKYKSEYLKIIQAEVNQGWMLPLPIGYINTLHHG